MPRPDGSPYSSDPKERHTQLVEDGKLAGPGDEKAREWGRKGGRPRKPRVAELLAQKAKDNADRIWAAYDDALSSEDIKIRMQAAGELQKNEREEDKLKLEEDKFDAMSKDDLVDNLLDLMSNPALQAALSPPPPVEQAKIGEGFSERSADWDGNDAVVADA